MIIAGVSTPKKWHLVSWSIKKLTESKASHAFIVFNVCGKDMVFHATSRGVNLVTYEKFKKKNDVIRAWSIETPHTNEILFYGFDLLDKKYDFKAIAGFLLWVLPNKYFGRKVKNPYESKSAYFCSELIIRMFREFYKYFDRFDESIIAPEDLICIFDDWEISKSII